MLVSTTDLVPRQIARYGWKPDPPDIRDYPYQPRYTLVENPPLVDLRTQPFYFPCYDQTTIGSCHDDKTEVLTDRGWQLFSELKGSERLASVNPEDCKLIFELPTRLIRFPYSGNMIGVNNQSLDFRVTPDHKMLVRKWNEKARTLNDTYEFVSAKDIGWYAGLMNRVSWAGESVSETYTLPGVDHKYIPQRSPKDVPMATWLRFLGIFLAEGTLLDDKRSLYKIQLAASKDREKSFIRETMMGLGQHVLELHDRFTFSNKQIYSALKSLGLHKVRAPKKFVPDFVFNQSSDNIKEFLLGHFMGDGCQQYVDGSRSHYTSSFQLADDLQRLIFLSGQETRMVVRQPRSARMTADGRTITGTYPEHRVSVCERKGLSIQRKDSVFTEHYDGEVFCAEVPTYHTLITKRNGKILISGNCTSQSIAGLDEFVQRKEGLANPFTPSRLFIYYGERFIEGTVDTDAGAMIRDGLTVLSSLGAPPEADWPYIISQFAAKPPQTAYDDAKKHVATNYYSLPRDLSVMKACLVEGYPFSFGFTVYSSFESPAVAQTGIAPLPLSNEQVLGGHAVLAVGYDDSKSSFIVRNSWGVSWGIQGHFYLPYEYFTNPNLSDDFWTLRVMS